MNGRYDKQSPLLTVKNNFLLFFQQWLLLQQIKQIDLSIVLQWAAKEAHEEVVKLLLTDKRIDSTIIQLARQNCQNPNNASIETEHGVILWEGYIYV